MSRSGRGFCPCRGLLWLQQGVLPHDVGNVASDGRIRPRFVAPGDTKILLLTEDLCTQYGRLSSYPEHLALVAQRDFTTVVKLHWQSSLQSLYHQDSCRTSSHCSAVVLVSCNGRVPVF